MEWEVKLIELIQNNMGSLGILLGEFFSFLASEKGLLLLLLIMMFCWKKDTGKKLTMTVVSLNVWLPMIKTLVMRPRPYMSYPERIKPLVLVEADAAAEDVAAQGYSFPSMHSASASGLFLYLAKEIKTRPVWIVSILLAFLVGFFRVAVGVHYPTDVLAGWTLGILAIAVSVFLERSIKNKWIRSLIPLLIALPGVFYVRTQEYFTALGLMIGIIFAFPFEEKHIDYKATDNIFAMILRVLGAFVIYIVLNTLFKLPFRKAFLESVSLLSLLVRTARYAIIIFVMLGIYPWVFPLFEKIGKKK